MKATGIVRRIDDLGRVVIPKEIRRTLRIREGDPLEIFTDREGEIILKKYSPIGELGAIAKEYAESLAHSLSAVVCITDTDMIIAAAGSGKKDLQDKYISKEMEQVLEQRTLLNATREDRKYIKIVTEIAEDYTGEIIAPILCEGDVIGSVVILEKDAKRKFGDMEQKFALCAADFLGRQMEQ